MLDFEVMHVENGFQRINIVPQDMRRIVWWWSVVVCYGGWGQLPSKSDGLLAPCGFHSHPRLCPYFAHTIVRYTTELAFRHDGCGGEVLVLRTPLHLGSPWSRVTKSTSKPGGPGDPPAVCGCLVFLPWTEFEKIACRASSSGWSCRWVILSLGSPSTEQTRQREESHLTPRSVNP